MQLNQARAVLILLLLSVAALAQQSPPHNTLSGTVTDPSGHPYAFAAYTIQLTNPQGSALANATFNQQPILPTRISGTLDVDGAFSVSLVPDSAISPASRWTITLSAPADSSIQTWGRAWDLQYAANVTSDLDVSAALSALAHPVSYINLRTGQSTIGGAGGLPAGVTTNGSNGLTLSGTPSAPTDAATVAYVTAHAGALPATVLYVSKLGCAAQDVDLMTGAKQGGGAATDDGPCINAALAPATAYRPIQLIQDGASLVSGIHGPTAGNWEIDGQGWNTGFFAKAGTNNDVIHNGTAAQQLSDIGGVAPARGQNVSIRNLFINGNRGDGTTGNSTTGYPQGTAGLTWYFGINLTSIDHIVIDHVRFFNIPAYNLRLNNVGDAVVENSHFENVLPTQAVVPQNGDGIHVDGPANDLRFSKNYFRTTDDAIALNAAEGYVGLITRVTVSDSVSHQSQTMMRIYTGSQAATGGGATPLIDGVTVNNYSGDANVAAILFGVEVPRVLPVPSSVTNFKWSNSTISAPWGAQLYENMGVVSFDNVTWKDGTNGGFIQATENASTVDSLSLNNIAISRTAAGHGATGLIDTSAGGIFGGGSTAIARLSVNGVKVVDNPGSAYGSIPSLLTISGASSITKQTIAAVDPTNITTVYPVVPFVTAQHTYAGAGSYTFTHNLGSQFPVSTCYSTAGTVTPAYTLAATDGNNTAVAVTGAADLTCSFLQAAITIPTSPINVGLVEEWRMADGTGTTFASFTGTNSATIAAGVGAWGANAGFPGVPFTFNRTGSAGATAANATNTNFDGSTPFTLAVWMHPTSTSMSGILSNLAASPTYTGYALYLVTGNIGFQIIHDFSNNVMEINSPVVIAANNTYYVVATYDGSRSAAGAHIYVNGALVSPTVVHDTLTLSAASGLPLSIGNRLGAGDTFSGTMGYARIYNVVKTPAQIAAYYVAGPQ